MTLPPSAVASAATSAGIGRFSVRLKGRVRWAGTLRRITLTPSTSMLLSGPGVKANPSTTTASGLASA